MNLLHANDRRGEYPRSYYAATAAAHQRTPALQGAARADVCVIGGGYTGLSTALHLAQAGLDVILLEAHRLGFGASGRNGGQVGSGQRLDQAELEQMAGPQDARRLWELAEEAKALVRHLIRAHDMPVRYHHGLAHACRSQAEVAAMHRAGEKLARDYGYEHLQPLDSAAIADLIGSPRFTGGEIDTDAGHLHPLNFAIGLAQAAQRAGLRLHEGSEVLRIDHGAKPRVHTAEGHVDCDHLVLACNGYLGGLEPQIAARVMPINNFIVATEPLGPRAKDVLARNIAVHDTKFVVNYWRLSEDDRLLFGGGETYGYRFPKDITAMVRRPMLEIYPQLRDVRIDYAWGGTLAITMNRLPCFRRVAPNVLSASGYSGHGLAMATLAGRIIAEAITSQAGDFDLLARLPQPRFPGGIAGRYPLLVTAMLWYSLRDRLGI